MNEPGKAVEGTHDPAHGKRVKLAWRLFGVALVLVLAAELFVGSTGRRFGMQGWFGIGAWFSFLACVVLVALARLVGWIARRPERYYEDRDG
jgi:hypothetical protein